MRPVWAGEGYGQRGPRPTHTGWQTWDGKLTLDGALAGDIAILVDFHFGASPGEVEVGFDRHVGGRGRKETLVGRRSQRCPSNAQSRPGGRGRVHMPHHDCCG